jgi:hypothetical protein
MYYHLKEQEKIYIPMCHSYIFFYIIPFIPTIMYFYSFYTSLFLNTR